ncbi:MAG: hypothetical protein RJA25_527 [Bacteroidota bacterium]|mgnify:FL=1|jgi:galactose mutarotase-like enzyme
MNDTPQNNFEIITLQLNDLSAEIAVNIGNTLFSLKYKQKELLYFPFSLQDYKSNLKLAGNPFMHPWANRLNGEYMRIENKKHYFPKNQLHWLYRDANQLPLHGLLLKSDKWQTKELYEDETQCYHTAEFIFNDENLLSIFPYKHTVSITHQLQENTLTISTTIINQDENAMPISFGFHPYFLRNKKDTKLTIPASEAIEVNEYMIPTGNTILKEKKWNFINNEISLEQISFDDGFQSLQRNESKQAVFKIEDIQLIMEEQYTFAQIYTPNHPDKPYICVEPMTAATNALNANTCKLIKKGEHYTATFSIRINR